MPRKPNDKHFETDISPQLWQACARVNESRGRLSQRQLGEAMFRLWAAVPEWLRVLALFGNDGDALIRKAFAGFKLTVTTAPLTEDELTKLASADVDAALSGRGEPPGKVREAATKAG